MVDQQTITRRQQHEDKDGTSRRRFLQVGAALAGAALAATMLDQEESKAALQLGDVQGENDGPDAGVAGINTADGPGVLGIGQDGPAMKAMGCNAEGLYAHSESGYAVEAESDTNIAVRAISPLRTAILGSSTEESGVRGVSSKGSGVRGESTNSAGVWGDSIDGPGVRGESDTSVGVIGTSGKETGVHGASGSGSGVQGFGPEGIGVEGLSVQGVGVEGFSPGYAGVRGHTANAIGVLAEAGDNGSALVVKGRARFETAGNVIMPAGSDNLLVHEPLTTAYSHVSATFMAHPSPKTSGRPMIFYIDREPGYGFWIYLTEPVAVDTPISYLVVDPVAGEGPTRDPGSHS